MFSYTFASADSTGVRDAGGVANDVRAACAIPALKRDENEKRGRGSAASRSFLHGQFTRKGMPRPFYFVIRSVVRTRVTKPSSNAAGCQRSVEVRCRSGPILSHGRTKDAVKQDDQRDERDRCLQIVPLPSLALVEVEEEGRRKKQTSARLTPGQAGAQQCCAPT